MFSKIEKFKNFARYIIHRYATTKPPKIERLILKKPSSLLLSFFRILNFILIPLIQRFKNTN